MILLEAAVAEPLGEHRRQDAVDLGAGRTARRGEARGDLARRGVADQVNRLAHALDRLEDVAPRLASVVQDARDSSRSAERRLR